MIIFGEEFKKLIIETDEDDAKTVIEISDETAKILDDGLRIRLVPDYED